MKHVRKLMLLAVVAALSVTLVACGGGGGGGGGQLEQLDRPTSVRMTTNTPTNQVVTWNVVEGAVAYDIWISTAGATPTKRHTVTAPTDPAATTTNANLTFLDLERRPTSHSITIVAVADPDTHTDSDRSTSAASLVIDPIKFTTPTTVTQSNLVVSWPTIQHASHYIVTTRRTSQPTMTLPTSVVTAPAFPGTASIDLWSTATDTGRIAAGHRYEVTIVAHRVTPGNTWTQSDPSTAVVIDLVGAATLNTPARPTEAAGVLTWTAPTGATATEYTVDIVDMPNSAVVTGLTYTLANFRLPLGLDGAAQTYNARVQAHGRGVHDSLTFSPTRAFTITTPHADAPRGLDEDEMLLEWDLPVTAAAGRTGQRIEYRLATDTEWTARTPNLAANADEFDLTTLNLSGGIYHVRVVAIYNTGVEAPSAPTAFTIFDNTLARPINPSIDSTTGILSWTHIGSRATGGYALYVIPVANLGDPLPAPTRTGTAWFGGIDAEPRTFNLNTELTLAPDDYMIQLRSLGNTWTTSELTGGIWFVKV